MYRHFGFGAIFILLLTGFLFAIESKVYLGCDEKLEKKIEFYLTDNEIGKIKLKTLEVKCAKVGEAKTPHYIVLIAGNVSLMLDSQGELVEKLNGITASLKDFFIEGYVKYDFNNLNVIYADKNKVLNISKSCYDHQLIKAYQITFRNKAYVAKQLWTLFPRGTSIEQITNYPIEYQKDFDIFMPRLINFNSTINELASEFNQTKDTQKVKERLATAEQLAKELKTDLIELDNSTKPFAVAAPKRLKCVTSCTEYDVCVFGPASTALDEVISLSNENSRNKIPTFDEFTAQLLASIGYRKNQAQIIRIAKSKNTELEGAKTQATKLQDKYIALGANLKGLKNSLGELEKALNTIKNTTLVADAEAKAKAFAEKLEKIKVEFSAYDNRFTDFNETKVAIDLARAYIISAQRIITDDPKLSILKENSTQLQLQLAKKFEELESGKIPTQLELNGLSTQANNVQTEVTRLVRPEDQLDVTLIIAIVAVLLAIGGVIFFLKTRGKGGPDLKKEIEIQKLMEAQKKKQAGTKEN